MIAKVSNNHVLPPVPLAVLVGCGLVFLGLHPGGGLGEMPWWAAGYLDDLICLPLILGAVLIAHRLGRRSLGFTLPFSHGIAAFLFFCIYFEVLLPQVNPGFTADPWDVAVYAVGFAIFQQGINRPFRKSG